MLQLRIGIDIAIRLIRSAVQIGVVGFSDDSIAAHIGNGPTTVKQPTTQIGEAAARMMLQLIQGEAETLPPETVVLATELIVRGSSQRVNVQFPEG
jgi:DNA-binding LacI/PurR family transcriptional regulator